MLIHIDPRRMLREFQVVVGNLSRNLSRNVVLYSTPAYHFYGYDKRAITYVGKRNLQGATSRRYANSTINHILIWNN